MSMTENSFIRIHWAWHLLILAAGLILCMSYIFDVSLVERLFSDDQSLSENGVHYLKLMRVALLFLAAGLIFLWTLRKVISRDHALFMERWNALPRSPDMSEVVVPVGSVAQGRIFWILLSVLVVTYLALLYRFPGAADYLTDEGGFFESLTAGCYLFAGIISLRMALPCFLKTGSGGVSRWYVLGLALFCIFVAGEESNWGEVYLHYEAGEFIRKSNYQGEVSLHNIALPVVGSYWANRLFEMIIFFGGYIMPVLIVTSKFFRRFFRAAEIYLPPLPSLAFFFVAATFSMLFGSTEAQALSMRANTPAELWEFTFSAGIAIYPWALYHKLRTQNESPAGPRSRMIPGC